MKFISLAVMALFTTQAINLRNKELEADEEAAATQLSAEGGDAG